MSDKRKRTSGIGNFSESFKTDLFVDELSFLKINTL